METLRHDIAYAFRTLARSPGFALVAILTLAIGIGANAAIFSVVNSAVFQPLPYEDSHQIVRVFNTRPDRGWDHINISYPDLTDFAAHTQTLEGIAGFTRTGVNLAGEGEPERLQAALVTPGLFEIVRLRPLVGRTIASDDVATEQPVANITEPLWRRRFASQPDIVGKQVVLNARTYTIIGVVPQIPRLPEVWIPLSPSGTTLRRSNRFLQGIARMKPGVALEQAQAELAGIARNLEQAYPDTNKGHSVNVETLKSVIVDREDKLIFGVLLGFVTLVLAIACANIANLLLSRAGARQKEMAIRATLGAGPQRLVRQLLTESLVLSGIGGVLGIGAGYAGLQLLLSVLPPFVPRLEEMRMDGWAVAYTTFIAVLTGVLFGLAPATQLSRPDLNQSLKQGSGFSGAAGRKWLRNSLAVSQVALALGLLICAGVFLQAFLRMTRLDMGFQGENVLTFEVTLPRARYEADEHVAGTFQTIVERIRALPGVEEAGITSRLPMGQGNLWRGYMREGDPVPDRDSSRNALYYAISPGYLPAIRVPLLAGRYFEPRDESVEPKVAIINQVLAQRLWPGESAVGKRIRIHTDEDYPREIVGVVGNTLYDVEDDLEGQVYVPHRQTTWSTMTVAARVTGDPYALRNSAQRIILDMDENLPIYSVRSMGDIVFREIQGFRVLSGLMGTLGVVALGLAVMGIYGVVSFSVLQRTREIGVRVALGAQRRDVIRLVLRQGAVLAGIGLVIGMGIGLAVNKLLANGFPELVAVNPWLAAGAAAMLGAIALIACYVPALRATRVSPLEALRYE